jgi:hypothetical protein
MGAAGETLIIDGANARPQTAAASRQFMEENGTASAPHPPRSLDLAPSDFHLLGYVKHCLRGQPFETAGELFSASQVISMGLEKSILNVVFPKWMQRLR